MPLHLSVITEINDNDEEPIPNSNIESLRNLGNLCPIALMPIQILCGTNTVQDGSLSRTRL